MNVLNLSRTGVMNALGEWLRNDEAALRALLAYYDERSAVKYLAVQMALAHIPGTPENLAAKANLFEDIKTP